MDSPLFTHNRFSVEEIYSFFRFTKRYTITDEKKVTIGHISQTTNAFSKLIHTIVSYTWLSFSYDITDINNKLVARFKKNAKPWEPFMAITDEKDTTIGYIGTEFHLVNNIFKVSNTEKKVIATIVGNWSAKKYEIRGENGQKYGNINITKEGILKRIIMPKDSFNIEIDEEQVGLIERNLLTIASLLIPIIFYEVNT